MRESKPLQVRVVRGTPIKVRGRTITPVARLISSVRHRATISAQKVEGSGWGFARVTPIRLIEERDGRTRRISIPDRTHTVLGQMTLVALFFPALCAALIAVASWLRDLD